MLRHIFIKNIALIDAIEINFFDGLNILTGETGAGKSIIIDSINILLGNRVSKELIRTGQNTASVEAIFEMENNLVNNFLKDNELIEDDCSELILSREFNIQGKNVCRINGRIVSLSMLKELGQFIIDIHGQHDNQSLLNTASHIDLLDSFGGDKITLIKNEYIEVYKKVKEIKLKLSQIGGDQRERDRKLDLLKFQLDEIESLKLKVGEDVGLETQKNLIVNSGKMVSSVELAYDILYGGNKNLSIIDALNVVNKELSNIKRYDSKIDDFINKIEEVYYSTEDIINEIRQYKESLEFDPKELEVIEERLDKIFSLKRKYGTTIEEILNYRDSIKNEIDELDGSQEKINEYIKELNTLNEQMYDKALKLSNERKKIAKEIEVKIVKELEDLEMKRTQFQVRFENIEGEYTSKGFDNIEFLISPNIGESLKSLSKIASGGEMSRIMLAIKSILANADKIPTLIFDEIDIGVSGKAAQMVGQKLSNIAKTHQVICITHLAQIASMADNHYLIEKMCNESETKTTIKKLNINEKHQEIARIIGGIKITETTIMHAKEMVELAQQKRNA